ncbi:MAG: gliding motility lipoprotein GldD [Bacteroidota bacterium]|nr:gliding motility lipoprotein GldD [Bacteroidota bacterium]
MQPFIKLFSFLLVLLIVSSCKNTYTPKPRSYFRIYFPERGYKTYDSLCPFIFDFPIYAKVEKDKTKNAKPCWLNVVYKPFNATIHITYKKFKDKDGLYKLTEDTRTLVYKHTVKAEKIKEELIVQKDKVSGMFYELRGNTATSYNFFLTDSVENYIYASLYFSAKANSDSLQPVLDFIKVDIKKMIATFDWKKEENYFIKKNE